MLARKVAVVLDRRSLPLPPYDGRMQQSTDDARERWVTPSRKVQKPWGHEEIFALVDGKFCGKALFVKAGHALSLQYHERKEETIAVQSGRVRFEVGRDASVAGRVRDRPRRHDPRRARARCTA